MAPVDTASSTGPNGYVGMTVIAAEVATGDVVD
jgi:hypothetical protein